MDITITQDGTVVNGVTLNRGAPATVSDFMGSAMIAAGIAVASTSALPAPTSRMSFDVASGRPEPAAAAAIKRSVGQRIAASPRRRIAAFGNSIAAHSSVTLYTGAFVNGAAAKSGTNVLQINNSDQTAVFTAGKKVAAVLYSNEVFLSSVQSSSYSAPNTTITLNDKLPKYVRASASAVIAGYTTASPSNIAKDIGELTAAVALLGGNVDVVQGYSFGGAITTDMMVDFIPFLKEMKLDDVWLRLFENDIPNGASLSFLQSMAIWYAKTALQAGVRPIMGTPYPMSAINTAATCGVWDAMVSWMLNTLPTIVPGVVVVNTSTWLDPANGANSRAPLATVASDGTHPDSHARWHIGALVAPQLPPDFSGNGFSYLKSVTYSANPTVSGTGGANVNNGGTSTGQVAAGWTLEAAGAGVTATASKNADDSQKVVFAVAGTGNNGTTTALFRQTINLPAHIGSSHALRPVFKLRANSLSGMEQVQVKATFTGGESCGCQAAPHFDTSTWTDVIGKTVVIEGGAFRVPDGATSVQLILHIKPKTGSNNASADIDIFEADIIPDVVPAMFV